ncbi:MAG: hypothetical protein V1725_04805 [archaeon]
MVYTNFEEDDVNAYFSWDTDTIYSDEGIEQLREDDEISGSESAFMTGYNTCGEL